MGSGVSTPELADQARRSRQIDRQLEKDKENSMGQQKLLLLGTGECGKSTILKQIQILHANGFTAMDLMEKKSAVFENICEGMAAIIDGVRVFSYTLSAKHAKHAHLVLSTVEVKKHNLPFTPDLFEALKSLWKAEAVQKTFDRRNELQVPDSISYFLDDLDRIYDDNYVPTHKDILHIRIPTTGVVQLSFNIKGNGFNIVDVGGQRSERKKWLHQFDDVAAIIFISAISEYDQILNEDKTMSTMILFLNKRDLFIEKIKRKNISILFNKYQGTNNYDECILYLHKVFKTLADLKTGKMLYIHETCATDTNQVQLVIDSVIDSIINKNLKGTGIEA